MYQSHDIDLSKSRDRSTRSMRFPIGVPWHRPAILVNGQVTSGQSLFSPAAP